MKTRPLNEREHGAVLVTTLIVVAVLAVAAAALVQTTLIDRLTSRSFANHHRAQLAAEAGLAVAKAMLATQTTNDHYIIAANANAQLFAGVGTDQAAGTFAYRPLFSFTGVVSDLVGQQTNQNNTIFTAGVPQVTVDGAVRFTNDMPGGFSVTSPLVTWIYLTDEAGQTNARVAFWIEDLAGRLDLSVVGATSPEVARRPTGTNPAEIALWSLFSANAPGNPTAAALVNNREAIRTVASARLAASELSEENLADLASNLLHDTNEPILIPFGFGYSDAGNPKIDLNAANFDDVAGGINRNLPNFGGRGGGLTSAAYVNNIAANIIDFIDADSTPTAGADYRGLEPLPFLNERMTRFVLQGPPVNEEGRWIIRIETTEYFEFWNLHSRTSPAVTLNFAFTNNQPLQYSGLTNFNIQTNYSIALPAMPPGSYFVTNSPTITNEFEAVAFASPSTNPICVLVGNSRTVQYRLESAGSLFDRGSGSHYSDKNLRPNDRIYFSPSYPGLGSKRSIAGLGDADFLNSVGDPRASFYMVDGGAPRPQIQPSWTNGNTSFGGRTIQSGFNNTNRLTWQVRMEYWGDGGHSGALGSRGSGATPPASGFFVTNETTFAPAFANPNTNGRLDRITDLGGGVFDPLQWAQTGQSVTNFPNEPGAWTNLTTSATPNTAYVGGNTLRLGRPEFTRFTNDGTRASQLLDIFAISTATNVQSGTLLDVVPGRININTAGTNVLRALAAGVFHTNDARVVSGSGSGTNFSVSDAAVNAFVAGVTTVRSQRPFFSTSQLPMIATNNQWPAGAVFGNRQLLGVTAGNAAVAEEWFGRIYPLTSVRSRNFVIHVVGQALQPRGSQPNALAPVATSRLAAQIYLEPMRNAEGLTTNSMPRVLRSWSL